VSQDPGQRLTPPDEAGANPPVTTIHEAELAPGLPGAVEYGVEIDESGAVALRRNGEHIVVRGDDIRANRSLAYRIEIQVWATE
jgi:hypothetical protein